MSMHRLPESTVRQISSAQVISSVASVVKELVENAIDAASTNIDVRLENFGLDKIEIRDNGIGIKPNDVNFVAMPHYTSKLQSFDDLAQLLTYGFRGEALASLCSVADVVITTKAVDIDIGSSFHFDVKGNVIDSKPSHLPQGTTVTATDLFKRFPVRRNYYSSKKKCREELHRCEECLAAFAVVKPHLRITFRHNKEVVWTKVAVNDIKQSLAAVVGSTVVASMRHITRNSIEPMFELEAFLPEPGAAGLQATRSTGDRLMIFVNERPVSMPEISKLLRNSFSHALSSADSATRFPIAFVSLVVPPSVVDVNLEPNKTRVLLHNQADIMASLSNIFEEVYGCPTLAGNKEPESITVVATSFTPTHCSELVLNHSNRPPDIKSNCFDVVCHQQSTDGIANISEQNMCDLAAVTETIQPASFAFDEDKMFDDVYSDSLVGCLNDSGGQENRISASSSDWLHSTSKTGKNRTHQPGNGMDFDVLSDRHETTSIELENLERNSDQPTERNNIELISFDDMPGTLEVSGVVPGVELSEEMSEVLGVYVPVVKLRSSRDNEVPDVEIHNVNLKSIIDGEVIVDEVLGPSNELSCQGLIEDVIAADWSKGHAVRDSMNNLVEPVRVLTGKKGFLAAAANSPAACVLQAKQPTLPDLLSGKVTLPGQINQDITIQGSKRKSLDKVTAVGDKQSNKKCKSDNEKGMRSVCIDKLLKSSRENDAFKTTQGRSVTLPFSWSRLTAGAPSESKLSAGRTNQLRVIGALKSHGVWVCLRDEKEVLLLHSIRAKEQMMYFQMMSNHTLPVEPLEQHITLDAKSLCSADCYKLLLSMAQSLPTPTEPYSFVIDERLVKNGFIIRCDSNDRTSLQVVSMTRCIGFYGLLDLNEILTAILRTSQCELINCRPLKVKHYFQAEASRISRRLNSGASLTEVKDIVTEMSCKLPPDFVEKCFHNRPIFVRLCSINDSKIT